MIGAANGTWEIIHRHHNEQQKGLQKPELGDVFPRQIYLRNNKVELQLLGSFETLVLACSNTFVFSFAI